MKRERWLWVVAMPTAWLVVCTLTAGWQKLFSTDPKIGFLSNAKRFADAAAQGQTLAPAKSLEEMQRIVGNYYIDATLCGLFMAVVVAILLFGLRAVLVARRSDRATAQETPYVALATVKP